MRGRDVGPFAIVPEWLIGSVSANALKLFCVLARYANSDGRCWPSVATIAERLGATDRSIQRWMAELVEAGAVVKHPRTTELGDSDTNDYELRFADPRHRTPVSPPRVESVARGRDGTVARGRDRAVTLTRATRNESQSERENTHVCDPDNTRQRVRRAARRVQAEDGWERFRSLYPRRFGANPPKPARERFQRLVERGLATADELVAACERYRAYCNVAGIAGTQYVKQMQYFLSPAAELWKEEFLPKDESSFPHSPCSTSASWSRLTVIRGTTSRSAR